MRPPVYRDVGRGDGPEQQSALERRIRVAGVPFFAGTTPEQEAVLLLETAAEIEHGLLVEYLYAAYSCQDPTIAASIATIAKQEMGHMVTVQNLRLLLGADPYLFRYDLSTQPTKDPFPFALEPLSLDSVARYATCEAPDDVSGLHPDLVAAANEAKQRATGTATFVNQVGALYAKLYWLFMPDDDDVGEWAGFPRDLFKGSEAGRHVSPATRGALGRQAKPEEWIGSVPDLIVLTCADTSQARAAIYAIAAQGEGSQTAPHSHFEQFIKNYLIAKTVVSLARDVPSAPTLQPAQPGTIDHPQAVPLVRVCDSFYNLLIIETLLALALDGDDPTHAPLRQQLIEASVEDMTQAVRRISMRLVRGVPRTAGQAQGDLRRAAPTFALTAPATGDRPTLVATFSAAIVEAEQRVEELRNAPNDPIVAPWPNIFDGALLNKRQLLDMLESLA